MKKLFTLLLVLSLLLTGNALAVTLPAFDYPTATYTNIGDSGLPLKALLNVCPQLLSYTFANGVLTVPDDGYDHVQYAADEDAAAYVLRKENDRWTVAVSDTEEQVQSGIITVYVSATRTESGTEAVYRAGTLAHLAVMDNSGNYGIEFFPTAETPYVQTFYYTFANGDYLWGAGDLYRLTDYSLFEHDSWDCNGSSIRYDASGRILWVIVAPDNEYVGVYFPGYGWYDDTDMLTPIPTPASMAQMDLGSWREAIPPRIPGLSQYPAAPAVWEASVPAGTTKIEADAFQNTALVSLKLPEGLTAIDAGTFSQCNRLEAIWIPASVTAIAPDAFSGCSRVVLHVESGSAAETFARQSGLNYAIH